MKLKILLTVVCALHSPLPQGHAQNALDPDSHILVKSGSSCNLLWNSTAGRTYFVRMSFDLHHWTYFDTIITGDGGPKGLGFQCSEPRAFVSLIRSDKPTDDPASFDFDGDGLSSAEELAANPQSDPVNLDTDRNGVDDGGLTDRDGDGIPTAYEIANGLDPLVANGAADLANYLNSLTTTSSSLEVFSELK